MRIVVVAHGPTPGMRDLRFGDRSGLEHPEAVRPTVRRVAGWFAGPEPACAETARLLGGEPVSVPGLAAPDAGAWAGRTLDEIAALDPERLGRWLRDPYAGPPGGETWADAVERVGRSVDRLAADLATADPTAGAAALVVTASAARAIAAHAVGLGPALVFAVDVAPLAEFTVSGSPARWRLRLGQSSPH